MGLSSTYYRYVIELQDRFSKQLKLAGYQASNTYNKLQSQQNNLNKSAQNYGSIMKSLIPIITVASVAQLGKKAIQNWEEQQAAIENVKAGLLSTSNAAGKSLEQLIKQSEILQSQTIFGDESILQNVTAQFLTFTNISGKAFDRAQQAALDVSSKLYGTKASAESLRTISIQLGKALNDPVSNLSALSRSGIQFSEQQEELIKQLWKSGQQAKAQSLILDELNRQYGGAANAIANTDYGRAIQSQNRIGDSFERIGQLIAPLKLKFTVFLEKVVKLFVQLLEWIQRNKNIILIFAGAIGSAIIAFKSIILIQKSVIAIMAVYKTIVFTVTAFTRGWAVAQRVLNIALLANPIGLIIAAVTALAVAFYIAWQKCATFRGTLFALWNTIKLVGQSIKNVFLQTIKDLLLGFKQLGLAFVALIKGKFSEAAKLAGQGIANISVINPIRNAVKGAKSIGTEFGEKWQEGFEKGKNYKPKGIKIPGITSIGNMTGINGVSGMTGMNNTGLNTELQTASTGITEGGARPTNITINLQKLNEKIEIHTTNIRDGIANIEEQFVEMFLRVLNSSAKLTTQ
jgi:hypothetical protein